MTRPTKEVVDQAVAYADNATWAVGDHPAALSVLAAEVVALREELARAVDAYKSVLDNENYPLPRYSTEAVDALAEAWYDWDVDGGLETVRNRMDAVIASREPPL